jgi:hypothetical protein
MLRCVAFDDGSAGADVLLLMLAIQRKNVKR